jgi:hypothetical protein
VPAAFDRQQIIRLIPSRRWTTLKLIRRPISWPLSLKYVNIGDRLDRFQLHNDGVFDKQVDLVPAWDLDSLVDNGELDFLLHSQATFP